jgi:hypothetical protein
MANAVKRLEVQRRGTSANVYRERVIRRSWQTWPTSATSAKIARVFGTGELSEVIP